jgi:hypothetical protein
MPVSSSTEHWIKPDALTINLNHFGDPDYLQVSVLAGAVVMAFKQDVIGYNASHNYRTWPLEAANTYLETSSAYNVYARLTRSEVNARALVIYDPILRDIEGREITYEKNEETGAEKEILGEPNENFYFIFLGQLSSSISQDGRSILREWTSEYRSGSLETNEQQNGWMAILNKMFRPHYDDPLNPDTLTWIEAKAHMGVAGGLTSFINNGTLKLPSIYDGLPIDGDTLYWVLDDNGNKVMLKSKGGGSGGGVADSVHWDNIDGKPDFSQYVTNDSLLRYLPLSGGTMTGKITLPVGIGTPSLDWGENGSLGGIWVSSTGIFQIIAESEFRVLTNVDGVSTRQFGISNAGNMGVTGTLLVGKGGYLTNSQFKFYVYDGDAFIDGMLAVDGNVNPNIPSMYNIGDSSKRFACVYADSVDVGGVKISLLQDGVLLIDGNLAVTGGITSYVDGGNLDLPSIYDGLPIDGDTLYWVLDENGKKVMLKSKGDNNEGGGVADSVNWDNIEGKPSWIGDSKPSYSYTEIIDTPDLTKYALKENIPSLSGYATIKWVNDQSYVTSSALNNYLPLSGELPDNMYKEFTLQGNLRLKDKSSYGRKLIFGDGEPPRVYLYEQKEDFLSIYAHAGMKIYTQTTNYIELEGKGIKVNSGKITYNESGGYFELDGNLLVTGGITAFADSGAGNQWILDTTSLSGVTSTNQYKVYSARVTKLLKEEVDDINDKITDIKTAFNGLSDSSSAAAIVSALKTLASIL